MKLKDIENMDKEFLTADDVAPYFGWDAQSIREQSRRDASWLGFPVVMQGNRVLIPRRAFVSYMKYGALRTM